MKKKLNFIVITIITIPTVMIGLAVGPTSALLLATASGQWSRLLWHGEAWSAAYNRSHFISLYSVLNILFIFSYLIWSSAFFIFYLLLILYVNAHSLFIFHFFPGDGERRLSYGEANFSGDLINCHYSNHQVLCNNFVWASTLDVRDQKPPKILV